MSLVAFCSNTKQNATAHRNLRWLTTNGKMDTAFETACLHKLETLAGKLGNDDLVREYSEKRD